MTRTSTPAHAGATEQIAAFLADLRFEDIPRSVVEHAKLCLLDTLGCVVYGQRLPWSRALRTFAHGETDSDLAAIWGTDERTSPGMAALVNGTAGHGFEIDDLLMSGLFHPGSVTIPAAMSTAEGRGGGSGKQLLTAVVAGYEVGARAGAALGQPHFTRGFHPQGTVGSIAAAAAAAVAGGCDEHTTVSALAIAASMASGLMGAQTGGMTKRLHSGRACQNGTTAAAMAASGLTGTLGILEAEFGGFLTTLCGSWYDGTQLTMELGTEWRTLETGFKAYAACAPIHTSIDAVLQLRAEHALRPQDIRSVVVHTTTHTQIHCGWRYEPSDATNAQMNLPYGVARALIDGDLFVDQFSTEAIADPSAVELASRVTVRPREDFDALGTTKRHTSEVEISTVDGSVLTCLVEQRTGSLEHPLTRARLVTKFQKLTRDVYEPARRQQILSLIEGLDELPDCTELAAALG